MQEDYLWYFIQQMFNRVVNLHTVGEAVGDWYFDRAGFHQHIDPYSFARDCQLYEEILLTSNITMLMGLNSIVVQFSQSHTIEIYD
ncbi:hypothetical protein RND71_042618 [Anisodus tanguticus]|uniref:Uncharacterized protein n=1 Tax=Anisodus tanguticus TaxID=243964 RepID=A0AAE1QRS7_9SOLA|nr:hypothetical protein RND71_042618 [Anisodus tanguticus]